jgi:hypothetical protein
LHERAIRSYGRIENDVESRQYSRALMTGHGGRIVT